jgi:ATP-dependent DNA helicase RecG
MPIDIVNVTNQQMKDLLSRGEGHFLDFKSTRVDPAKLTRLLSAFSNADGGELFVGVEDGTTPNLDRVVGFASAEDANGHIQALEAFFPLGSYFKYDFLRHDNAKGLILRCEIFKTPDVRRASDGRVYLRRGAQSLPQTTEEQLSRVRLDKGISSYEDFPTVGRLDDICLSETIRNFMREVVPSAEPRPWLEKQRLITDDRPTVAGIVLYADEPQSILPKTAIKIYRYRTSGAGTRDTLAGDPVSIEGPAYDLIHDAIQQAVDTVESISVVGPDGLEKAQYPRESIHEIVTNAVIHRDYSINDDIHITRECRVLGYFLAARDVRS